MKTDIVFIKVTDNKTKLARLCESIQEHFVKGDRILLSVSNQESACYLDELLWRMPPEGFLPHQISTQPIEEQIVITLSDANVNKAQVLFNLRQEAYADFAGYACVYELFDESHPDKLKQSLLRQASYPYARMI